MADLTRLRNGLQGYDSELARHEAEVRSAYDQLQRSLSRLSSVYEGTGASAFKAHWASSKRGLDSYLSGVKDIRRLLGERIDVLAQADRGDGL